MVVRLVAFLIGGGFRPRTGKGLSEGICLSQWLPQQRLGSTELANPLWLLFWKAAQCIPRADQSLWARRAGDPPLAPDTAVFPLAVDKAKIGSYDAFQPWTAAGPFSITPTTVYGGSSLAVANVPADASSFPTKVS
jgi:hypothetical protein